MSTELEVRSLARSSCANHSNIHIKDGCLVELDGNLTCRYFRDNGEHARCRYFESSVLPSDTGLEARYFGGTKSNLVRCAMCHKDYVRTSNRQRYCTDCRDRAQTEARRKRDARYRRNKSEQTTL